MREMEWEWRYTSRAIFMPEILRTIKDTERDPWCGSCKTENITTTRETG
jgi:hypothetical protein